MGLVILFLCQPAVLRFYMHGSPDKFADFFRTAATAQQLPQIKFTVGIQAITDLSISCEPDTGTIPAQTTGKRWNYADFPGESGYPENMLFG